MRGEETRLSSSLDAEEESPYLRRQKALAVRRRRFSGRLRWLVLAGAGLVVLGAVVCYLATWAFASPRFVLSSVDDIVLEGNEYVSRQEVLSALGIPGSARAATSVFKLSLVEGTRQVESIPWVRSATLARAYPNRLAVHVVERVPVAFASVGGRLKLVDGDGVLLEKPERAEFDFPVLTGLDAAPRLPEGKQRLALYLDLESQVAPAAAQSGWIISEVNLADADDLKALVVRGPETVELHFGDRDFVERFRSFLALMPEVRKTNAKLDSVDLRYENQIVVNPQKSSDK